MKKKIVAILLMAVLIISLVGCGSSKSSKTSKSNDTKSTTQEKTKKEESKKEEPKKEDTKVTYENYKKIKLGQTYDDVVSILGEGKEKSRKINGVETITYQWMENDISRNNATVDIQNGAVIAKDQEGLYKNKANITLDDYNKIQKGMTYDQVKAILGEGELTIETKFKDKDSTTYMFINKDGDYAKLTFLNDSLNDLAQIGLK